LPGLSISWSKTSAVSVHHVRNKLVDNLIILPDAKGLYILLTLDVHTKVRPQVFASLTYWIATNLQY